MRKEIEKKYELVNDGSFMCNELGLYRLRALRNFSDVKKGELGGYVAGEHSLSHDGNCWIYEGCVVSDNAVVRDNAVVLHHSSVSGSARVYGRAAVSDSDISGSARVHGRSLCMQAEVSGNADISEFARIFISGVFDDAKVHGNCQITYAHVSGTAEVKSRKKFRKFYRLEISEGLCNKKSSQWA